MKILTVIMRDDGPMIYAGDCPKYRSVRIELTKEQEEMLKPRSTYSSGGIDYSEDISRCFIEEE